MSLAVVVHSPNWEGVDKKKMTLNQLARSTSTSPTTTDEHPPFERTMSASPSNSESQKITQLFKRVRLQVKHNPVRLPHEDDSPVESSGSNSPSAPLSPSHGPFATTPIAPLPFRVQMGVAQITRKRRSSEIDSLTDALLEKCSCDTAE